MSFACKHCKVRKFRKSGACLRKHEEKCGLVPTTLFGNELAPRNLSHELFDFSDDYFDSMEKQTADSIANELDYEEMGLAEWLVSLKVFKQTRVEKKFLIFHLNINSLANKFHHVNEILSHSNCDLLFLNETKLDESMPSNLFNCNKYNLTRKERTGGKKGGGVAIYIKSCYTVAHIKTNHPFEIISFSLILHKKTRHFICAYKPPDTRAEESLPILSIFC